MAECLDHARIITAYRPEEDKWIDYREDRAHSKGWKGGRLHQRCTCLVCQECGEAYFTPRISRKIDKVMRDFYEGKPLARPIAAGEIRLEA